MSTTAAPKTQTDEIVNSDSDASNPPVIRKRSNRVSVAIFAREVAKKDGDSFTAYDVAVTRSFKTNDGDWGHTKTLEADDLLDLAFAAEDAHRELLAHKANK